MAPALGRTKDQRKEAGVVHRFAEMVEE